MKPSTCTYLVLSLLWATYTTAPVFAQTASQETQESQCRETVAKFEESMNFVRKSVGYEKAAEIKESLLPNKVESEIFAKEGYCGVARYLKTKKLLGNSAIPGQ